MILALLAVCVAWSPAWADVRCPAGAELEEKRYTLDGHAHEQASCRDRATGQRSGPFEVRVDGRLVQSETWFDGKLHGVQRLWHPDGRPAAVVTWDHGQRRGFTVRWDSAGRLTEYGQVALPRERGPYRRWHFRQGRPALIETQVGGVPNGREWVFHSNGRLRQVSDYRNGKPVGRALAWDEDGTFHAGWCYDAAGRHLWEARGAAEVLSRPCGTEPAGAPAPDPRVPAPSQSTQDLVPAELGLERLAPPAPPEVPALP